MRRSVWWLDVETHNTWESFEHGVGVYSTHHQWDRITGGASLGRAQVWYAGVGTKPQARRRCRPVYSFTGGPVRMTQFLTGSGLDGDLRC